MAYVFTRTEDYVIIENTVDGYLVTTRERATIKKTTNTDPIFILGPTTSLSVMFFDIGTIDGVTPTDANNAVLLLGKIFKGYPPVKITIE